MSSHRVKWSAPKTWQMAPVRSGGELWMIAYWGGGTDGLNDVIGGVLVKQGWVVTGGSSCNHNVKQEFPSCRWVSFSWQWISSFWEQISSSWPLLLSSCIQVLQTPDKVKKFSSSCILGVGVVVVKWMWWSVIHLSTFCNVRCSLGVSGIISVWPYHRMSVKNSCCLQWTSR